MTQWIALEAERKPVLNLMHSRKSVEEEKDWAQP